VKERVLIAYYWQSFSALSLTGSIAASISIAFIGDPLKAPRICLNAEFCSS
jgi:hypothetical protein